MDRRFLTVLGVSLVFALVVSSIFYQMTARATSPVKKAERTDQRDVVVAARALGIGVTVKSGDVKIVKMPVEQTPKGGFSKVEEVLDRPIVSNILPDEPVLEGRLALRGSGLGLAPIIPVGQRAVTVRVNEMVGVAGFVLPGLRVDVLVTGRPPEASSTTMTTTVLQNILVLATGQTIQPDQRGGAINAPTVTLQVSPDQAELLTLAGNEGRIQLILRNGSDQNIEVTRGSDLSQLFGRKGAANKRLGNQVNTGSSDDDADRAIRRRRVKPANVAPPITIAVAAPPPPVIPPPPPPPDEIITFRGTVKSIETVAPRKN
jgi:pilus assembly protein CpaB